jgi:acyl carrier protein
MTIQTMQTAEIQRDIRNFLVSNFLFGRGEALRDDQVLLGNVIDSSGALELIMFLQDHFSITVEDEEIAVPENFESVKSIVTLVAKKLTSKG